MKFFSSGEVAARLGVSRDSLDYALRVCGAPDPGKRIAGKRFFSSEEVKKLRQWFKAKAKRTKYPKTKKGGRRGNGKQA